MTQTQHPYFGAPPACVPKPAAEVKALRGKRVILSTPEGFVHDMRAASECRMEGGRQVVDIVTEEDWFRWMLLRQLPSREQYPIELVWVG